LGAKSAAELPHDRAIVSRIPRRLRAHPGCPLDKGDARRVLARRPLGAGLIARPQSLDRLRGSSILRSRGHLERTNPRLFRLPRHLRSPTSASNLGIDPAILLAVQDVDDYVRAGRAHGIGREFLSWRGFATASPQKNKHAQPKNDSPHDSIPP
jgi:hypothetical protein